MIKEAGWQTGFLIHNQLNRLILKTIFVDKALLNWDMALRLRG